MDESFKRCSDVDLCFRILLSKKWFLTTCPHVTIVHLGYTARSVEFRRDFDNSGDAKKMEEKWPHDKIMQVVEASKKGKFVIPIRI